jgi:DNA transformation protein
VATDAGFLEWLRELLEPMGRVAFRRMFGGHGVYLDGLFLAIVVDGRPYLKVDAETQAEFKAAGCAPFTYEGGGKRVEMSYWSVPESALDSAEDMRPWARLAVAAALRKPAPVKRARSAPSASKSRSAPRR